jgi:hypothetical protein
VHRSIRPAVAFFLCLSCIPAQAAPSKTAREKSGLIGPVQSVTTKGLGSTGTEMYDRAGNLIEAVSYEVHGSVSTRHVFSYDERDRLRAETGYDADGTFLYRKLFAYGSDAHDRETAVVAASQDGELQHAEFSVYDDRGFLCEQFQFTDQTISRNLFDVLGRLLYSARFKDGRLLGEIQRRYDSAGKLVQVTSYDQTGAVTARITNEYDDSGRRIRTITERLKAGAADRWVASYEYDDVGNWIKERTTQAAYLSTERQPSPRTIEQERSIRYYDSR